MSEKGVTFAETITGWKPINIKSGKTLLNGKILPILSCFLFLFDENKDIVLVSAKNNSGGKNTLNLQIWQL